MKQAERAGLTVAEEVLSYLLTHYSRDIDSQTSYLQQLDTASMQTGRRLTIPFVKEVLVEAATENA